MSAMGNVSQLFSPSRWVAAWEEIGGTLHLSEGPFADEGEIMPALLEWAPIHVRNDHRQRIDILRRQILLGTPERTQVIDFLARRAATRGW